MERLKGHVRPAKTQEASHMRQCYNEHCLGMKSKALILHVSQGELNLLKPAEVYCYHPPLGFPTTLCPLTKVAIFAFTSQSSYTKRQLQCALLNKRKRIHKK